MSLLLTLTAAAPAGAESPAAAPQTGPVRWTLDDVIATALARHPSIGSADAEARAAGAREGQAASGTLPQVGALAGWSVSEIPSSSGGDSRTADNASVQGAVSQLISDFGRTSASIGGAAELTAAARASGNSVRIEVAFAAKTAYFNVLRAAAVLAVQGETVRQRETLQKQAQAFFDAGVRARIDVVRAEANLFQARADLTGADHELRTARLVLLNRMGVDGPADFELAPPPGPVAVSGMLEGWQAEADERHPDLQMLRLQESAARLFVRAARGGNNPTLTANGRLGWSGEDLDLERSWTAGALLTVPVFNGNLTRRQAEEAEADLAKASFALADRRRLIRLAVEQAAQSIRDAEERFAARQKEREAFAENLRLATGRYEAGAGDIIEIVDAQVQMARAETNVVEAAFDRAVAVAALDRAVGRMPAP